MITRYFEVRVCEACGLRYPQESYRLLSERCPHCLGNTKVVSQKVTRREDMSLKKLINKNKMYYAVLLDNIRSAWNVGSIIRSADGLGFDHVYLCGISPTPENEAVKKTSLGAEDSIQWSYHKNSVELVQKLRNEGWKVLALEEDERAVEVHGIEKGKQKTLLIVGSEVTGVDSELLNLCNEVVYIPMQGEKRSLNVAIAFSVAAFFMSKK